MAKAKYIWDVRHDSYLMEQDGAGATTAVYTNEPVPFGRLISQRHGTTTSYYHFDGQGSTRELTDPSENVTDTRMYTALGKEIAGSGSTTNPFRYKGVMGYHTEPRTEDVQMRARTYEPTSGRWLSVSRRGLEWVNTYSYGRGDPIRGVDSSGMQTTSLWWRTPTKRLKRPKRKFSEDAMKWHLRWRCGCACLGALVLDFAKLENDAWSAADDITIPQWVIDRGIIPRDEIRACNDFCVSPAGNVIC